MFEWEASALPANLRLFEVHMPEFISADVRNGCDFKSGYERRGAWSVILRASADFVISIP